MKETVPFVSVIVPVYNAAATVAALLRGLAAQTYPTDRTEILLVDNGSSDATREIIASLRPLFFRPLVLLEETAIQGSYAARNRGLAVARGDIIAFTDADCAPADSWIREGVRCLLETGADLAGGRVTFVYAKTRPTAAELVDSRTNMQMESDIAGRGVAKTANLFVRRRVAEAVGDFPARLKSGGDVIWTGEATRRGFKLVYAPEAEVRHPARNWKALFIKQVRVGRGQVPAMRARGMSWAAILADSLRVRRRDEQHAGENPVTSGLGKAGVFAAMMWSRGATLLGRVFSLFSGK